MKATFLSLYGSLCLGCSVGSAINQHSGYQVDVPRVIKIVTRVEIVDGKADVRNHHDRIDLNKYKRCGGTTDDGKRTAEFQGSSVPFHWDFGSTSSNHLIPNDLSGLASLSHLSICGLILNVRDEHITFLNKMDTTYKLNPLLFGVDLVFIREEIRSFSAFGEEETRSVEIYLMASILPSEKTSMTHVQIEAGLVRESKWEVPLDLTQYRKCPEMTLGRNRYHSFEFRTKLNKHEIPREAVAEMDWYTDIESRESSILISICGINTSLKQDDIEYHDSYSSIFRVNPLLFGVDMDYIRVETTLIGDYGEQATVDDIYFKYN